MTTANVDIFNLDAEVEPLDTIDGTALDESNSYAPSIPPGYHTFVFSLDAEEPLKTVERGGKKVLEVTYSATHIKPDGTEGKTINFQRANGYKSEKMPASRLQELIHALGQTAAFNATPKRASDVLTVLQGAEGQRTAFKAAITWRHYDKETGVTTTTNPKTYTKRDKVTGAETTVVEQPWPKNEDGTFARHPGNEEIVRTVPLATKK